ncbi:hypothetical protein [Brucella anthropi]|uniref:hypothetical protein n=1 Tax=Brucella anthropi TaxID=529 RepID=UPI00178C7FA8|nr:hypothetical protein [Brucella anthropi]
MENLKKTVPCADRIDVGGFLRLLAELGMMDKDEPSERSSNPCQGKECVPIENIREYPRSEPAFQKECRAQKAFFIERVIKQRSHYTAPYILLMKIGGLSLGLYSITKPASSKPNEGIITLLWCPLWMLAALFLGFFGNLLMSSAEHRPFTCPAGVVKLKSGESRPCRNLVWLLRKPLWLLEGPDKPELILRRDIDKDQVDKALGFQSLR